MSKINEGRLPNLVVPVPSAYTGQLSYGPSESTPHNPLIYDANADSNQDVVGSGVAEVDSVKVDSDDEKGDGKTSTGAKRSSLLIFLKDSRIYVRVLAIVIMIISLSLILIAVVQFAQAKKKPGHPLDAVPKPSSITDYPCIVFSGVAAMNLVLSISLFVLSCVSSKFNKSVNAFNAAFAILSAIGFATSMGACFFLNKQTKLRNDLWKWSCDSHKAGVITDALDFQLVCHVVNYGWKFGLVQASLELLTFIISVAAFIILKYSYFVRYGRTGRIF
ncbi:hypothetical protein LHYA1_G002975 [Lachnellula hyalina]|uniref:MARVEL domain-containing protein n=1 Tax=Lachnellula hyalina TaxID=1316788 RepID=A0A8H8U0I8_9HELO|nr:uncharacterized protein LHYA1_G002975 [Lachnellula hyalina]TVY27370.1 hypothetical protein LHYA1_G002975 [Lachnellula hyalina]